MAVKFHCRRYSIRGFPFTRQITKLTKEVCRSFKEIFRCYEGPVKINAPGVAFIIRICSFILFYISFNLLSLVSLVNHSFVCFSIPGEASIL